MVSSNASRLALLRAVACFSALAAGAASAVEPDWYSPITEEGRGGAPGASVCPAGAFLVGLNARVGDDIDAVQALCATPPRMSSTASPNRLTAAPTPAPMGGLGGEPMTLKCPASAPFVRSLTVDTEGEDTWLVTAIHLRCGSLNGPLPKLIEGYNSIGIQGSLGFYSDTHSQDFDCPDTHVLAGVHGRAGLMVDALGIVCRPVQGGQNSLPKSNIVTGAEDIQTVTQHDVFEQALGEPPGTDGTQRAASAPTQGSVLTENVAKALAAAPAGGVLSSSIFAASPQDSAAVAEQPREELRCRGESPQGFSIQQADSLAGPGSPLVLYFIAAPGAAGRDGSGLTPGTCAFVDRGIELEDPAAIAFTSPQSLRAVAEYLSHDDHYWRFSVSKTSYGYFEARDNGPWSRRIAEGVLVEAPDLRAETTGQTSALGERATQTGGGIVGGPLGGDAATLPDRGP